MWRACMVAWLVAGIGRAHGPVERSEIDIATDAWMAGYHASATEAEAWEASLASRPDQPELRLKLVTFYNIRRFADVSLRVKRSAHIVWLIRNHPESPFIGHYANADVLSAIDGTTAFEECRAAWTAQVKAHPDDPVILDHAAAFYAHGDQDEAERLLAAAAKLDPGNPDRYDRLATQCLLGARASDPSRAAAAARRAVAALDTAWKLTPEPPDRAYLCDDLLRACYLAGDDARAKEVAEEWMRLVPKGRWDEGNAKHDAHTVLGLLSLKVGDHRQALSHLKESAAHKGSPQLDSFGPCMDLASALLDAGERKAVEEYLAACGTFWSMGTKDLGEWRTALRQGSRPDFSRHLKFARH